MVLIDRDWLQDFNEAMLRLYAIDQADAGIDVKELGWYCALPGYGGCAGLRGGL